MALAKDHTLNNSGMCLNHVYPYYESDHFGGSSIQGSDQLSPGLYGVEEQPNKVFEEGGDSSTKNFTISSSSSLSSPSSTNSSGLGYQTMKYQSDDGNSVINFKSGYGNSTHSIGSLLSFEKKEQFHQSGYGNREDFSIWENNVHHSYQNQLLLENSSRKSNLQTATTSRGTDFGREEAYINKRPYMEESSQPYKKQCTAAEKQLKPKSSPSKDPQSIAAKNRRERISERLKMLQELVPNGSKVDLVTMLEKAIGYVKFLQLQVKVLAADEFWPAQGGKAPDLSQVKEAIDAILASQRNRNSTSK